MSERQLSRIDPNPIFYTNEFQRGALRLKGFPVDHDGGAVNYISTNAEEVAVAELTVGHSGAYRKDLSRAYPSAIRPAWVQCLLDAIEPQAVGDNVAVTLSGDVLEEVSVASILQDVLACRRFDSQAPTYFDLHGVEEYKGGIGTSTFQAFHVRVFRDVVVDPTSSTMAQALEVCRRLAGEMDTAQIEHRVETGNICEIGEMAIDVVGSRHTPEAVARRAKALVSEFRKELNEAELQERLKAFRKDLEGLDVESADPETIVARLMTVTDGLPTHDEDTIDEVVA